MSYVEVENGGSRMAEESGCLLIDDGELLSITN